MNTIKNTLMAGILVVSTIGVVPALADHHHQNDNHGGNWDRRDINVRVNDNRYDDHRDDRNNNNNNNRYHNSHYRQNVYVNNDWNGQRTLYRNNWNRISRERQQELDAQMRAQWLAYHHNNYEGNYSWNNYNNPQFLDYLHTSNPGLLNTLRNSIGF
jgi:hypothetical protein